MCSVHVFLGCILDLCMFVRLDIGTIFCPMRRAERRSTWCGCGRAGNVMQAHGGTGTWAVCHYYAQMAEV